MGKPENKSEDFGDNRLKNTALLARKIGFRSIKNNSVHVEPTDMTATTVTKEDKAHDEPPTTCCCLS